MDKLLGRGRRVVEREEGETEDESERGKKEEERGRVGGE